MLFIQWDMITIRQNWKKGRGGRLLGNVANGRQQQKGTAAMFTILLCHLLQSSLIFFLSIFSNLIWTFPCVCPLFPYLWAQVELQGKDRKFNLASMVPSSLPISPTPSRFQSLILLPCSLGLSSRYIAIFWRITPLSWWWISCCPAWTP